MTVLRRLDAVLEPTKQTVAQRQHRRSIWDVACDQINPGKAADAANINQLILHGLITKETLENLKTGPYRILTPLSQQGFSKYRDWAEGVFQDFPIHHIPHLSIMTATTPSNSSSMGPDRTIRYSLSGAGERREVRAEGYFSGSPSEERGKKSWKFFLKENLENACNGVTQGLGNQVFHDVLVFLIQRFPINGQSGYSLRGRSIQ